MSKSASYDLRPLGIMPAGAAIQPGQVALAAAYQAPLPMGFSRQEYWSGVPKPSLQLMA